MNYDNIASHYKNLIYDAEKEIEEAQAKIDAIKRKSTGYTVFAIVFIIGGTLLIIKKPKKSNPENTE